MGYNARFLHFKRIPHYCLLDENRTICIPSNWLELYSGNHFIIIYYEVYLNPSIENYKKIITVFFFIKMSKNTRFVVFLVQ